MFHDSRFWQLGDQAGLVKPSWSVAFRPHLTMSLAFSGECYFNDRTVVPYL